MFVSSAGAADAKARLTKDRATAIFLANDKVADWVARYPKKGRVTDATYESDAAKCTDAQTGCWTVHVWWSKNKQVDAGEIAQGKVDDASARVTEAWTGPQVAWKMARGYDGAFGGKKINSLPVWLAFCAAFLLGLADFRRPLSLRNLDLLALLSFSVSLWFFNDGNIFTSVPLAYPPLVYLLARCVWIGVRGRPVRAAAPVWKPVILLAAAVFLIGFRIGLNLEDSNVIDVGYAGVIGAQRISSGVMPYDHFPKEDALKACGPADTEGEIRDRIQFNGRCESANPLGDTYGPVAYEAYLPGYWIRGWSGKWDKLPAVHLTSIIFDVLCALGLGLAGLRYGGRWLGAALAFAWAAFPFTQYVSMSNTNDAIVPVFLIFGLWLAGSPLARGAGVALSGWTKFATLAVAPLWLTYPGPVRWRRPGRRAVLYIAGFAARDPRGVFDSPAGRPPAPGGAHVLRPDVEDPDHARVAVLALGLGAVPRPRYPGSAHRSARAAGTARPRRRCRGIRPTHEDAAAARGADGRAPDRLRARADALVLPLHPVVLPLRRVCCAVQQWPRARRAQHLTVR